MKIEVGKLYRWKEVDEDIIVKAVSRWSNNHIFTHKQERWDIEIIKGKGIDRPGMIWGAVSTDLSEYQDPVDILKEML